MQEAQSQRMILENYHRGRRADLERASASAGLPLVGEQDLERVIFDVMSRLQVEDWFVQSFARLWLCSLRMSERMEGLLRLTGSNKAGL